MPDRERLQPQNHKADHQRQNNVQSQKPQRRPKNILPAHFPQIKTKNRESRAKDQRVGGGNQQHRFLGQIRMQKIQPQDFPQCPRRLRQKDQADQKYRQKNFLAQQKIGKSKSQYRDLAGKKRIQK